MKKRVWNVRIPTVFAFLILFVGLWITSLLLQNNIISIGHASPESIPQNVFISNITDTSFTVNFTTNAQTVAGVSVTGGAAPLLAYDIRDKKGGSQKFFSHFITVSSLLPKTTYQFSILSDGEKYLNQGKEYSVITGSKLTGQTNSTPIKGLVLLPEGGASGDSIIKIELPGSQIITSTTNDNGEYSIPTNNIRTADLANLLTVNNGDSVTLTSYRQDMVSVTKFLFSGAFVPPITMNQQYDFTGVKTQQETGNVSSELKTPDNTAGKTANISIDIPTASQSFVDLQPRFSGTALPNQQVKITIQSINATVTSDRLGKWSYRPDGALAPGQHTIIIVTQDEFGISRSESQTFSILPSGTQVGGNEDNPLLSPAPFEKPTVTPTPNILPTNAPTATPTIIPTNTPIPTVAPTASASITPAATTTPVPTNQASPTPTIIALAPTATPTIIPTNTPVPTLTPAPTRIVAIITPPPTGSNSSVILTAISVFLIFSGSALLFLL